MAQRALSVSANNVANAQTDGYARQVVRPQTLLLGGEGRGVTDAGTVRIVDRYLAALLRVEQAQLARASAIADALAPVGDHVLGAPGDDTSGLSPRLQQLSAALESFATTPERSAQRLDLQNTLSNLLDSISQGIGRVQVARRDVDQQIAAAVESVNTTLKSLEDINLALARSGPTPDLLDRRDALIAQVSDNLDVSVVEGESGVVELFTVNAIPLLDHGARKLAYRPAATVDPFSAFGELAVYRPDQLDASGRPLTGQLGQVLVTSGVRAELTPELLADAVPDSQQLVSSKLGTGRIQGLLEARDGRLPALADQLAELTELVRFQLNAAHNGAASVPPPAVMTGTRGDLSDWSGADNAGVAYIAVVNTTTGTTVATAAIDLTLPTPAQIAAQINTGLAGVATASFNAEGALEIATADRANGLAIAEGDSSIRSVDSAGRDRRYGFAHYFGLNDLVVGSPEGLRLRADIAADASRISTARLDVVTGSVPTSVLGGKGDNRGAQALAAALDSPVAVGARGGLPAGASTATRYLADLVASASHQSTMAEDDVTTAQTLVAALADRVGSISGVNVDEELARLVTYQQAYAVSARIIQVTDQLFEELLKLKG
jgi:flagellar hook-associated protein 1 FlgK